jgi:NAD(P)-dependent dehydrogenase (short-subunit alcohol dehydrogenase family)
LTQRARPFSSLLAVCSHSLCSQNFITDISPATGIGYSISESFAKAGIARIIIIQRREPVLAAAKASLEEDYPNTKVETYAASQSDFPRMTEIIQEVGEIDVLIPCATNTSSFEGGTAIHPIRTIKTENIAADYTVNVIGLFHMVKEFLALPSTASGGPKSVIHVSSAASQLYIPGMSSYCSTKSAANQVITHFAFDEPEGNVKFYSFHPGTIESPLAVEYVPIENVTFEDGESRIPSLVGGAYY